MDLKSNAFTIQYGECNTSAFEKNSLKCNLTMNLNTLLKLFITKVCLYLKKR